MLERAKSKAVFLLEKLGIFLQTDMRYIAVQGSWLASGQIVNNFISVFTTLAFANLLPKETFGLYKYILSLFGMFALSTLPGMESAVIKTVAEGFENVYKRVLTYRISWGLLGSLAALGTALYYFHQGNSVFGFGCVILAAAVPFFDPVTTYQDIMTGKKRFDLRARYYTATRLVSAVSIIATIAITKNLYALLVAYFAPYIVMGFVFAPGALRKLQLNNAYDPSVMHFGRHFSVMSLIGVGVNYLDSIIIFHFLGPVQLAVYSIAQAPVNRLQSLFSIVPEIALPKYAESSTEVIKASIGKKILKSMIVTAGIILLYILVVPFLFRFFLPQYIDSVRYAQLLSLSLIFYPFALVSRIRTAKGSIKALYWYNIIESASQLIIMLVMVTQYGLMGAVIGKLLVTLIGTAIYSYFIKTL